MLTEYERKVLSAYAEDYGVATMQDLINLTFSMKGLSLLTDFSDARQVGERLYLDEFLGISEEEKAQTNFIEFAEKTLKESRVEVLPYGVFVDHGFEMQEVYNEKPFRHTLHRTRLWQLSKYRIKPGIRSICICQQISVP